MKSPDWVLPRPSAARPRAFEPWIQPVRDAMSGRRSKYGPSLPGSRSTAVKSSQVKSSPSTLTSTASLESTFDRLVP